MIKAIKALWTLAGQVYDISDERVRRIVDRRMTSWRVLDDVVYDRLQIDFARTVVTVQSKYTPSSYSPLFIAHSPASPLMCAQMRSSLPAVAPQPAMALSNLHWAAAEFDGEGNSSGSHVFSLVDTSSISSRVNSERLRIGRVCDDDNMWNVYGDCMLQIALCVV